MNILVLAAIGLLVLVGLIAVGLGHKRWNWGTVAAAFLVLLSVTAYLYLAARVAARDRDWMQAVQRYETNIARARDALEPSRRGGLVPIAGQTSLTALEADRDRWRRSLSRVETWRSPGWVISTGSSAVQILRSTVLMLPSSEWSVVVLPEPVGPTTSTSP